MFGQNPILAQDLRSTSLAVQSIFHTIQGEGPFAGLPSVFVRLAGCWLKCHFCDTEFMSNINSYWTPQQIVDEIVINCRNGAPKLVVLTGGDPMRQNIVPLVKLLEEKRFEVQIETAGIGWTPGLEDYCTPFVGSTSIVVSPKTGKVHPEIETWAVAWKYIIDTDDLIDEIDGLPNSSTQVLGARQRLARPPEGFDRQSIYLQPCDRVDPVRNRRNVELVTKLALQHGYRVSLQTHKILGVE